MPLRNSRRRNHLLIPMLIIMALGLMIASSKSRQPFPELDLSRITMEEFVLSTPAGDTVAYDGDDPKDDSIVLAQPVANPLVPSSNPSVEILDVENPPAQDKEEGVSTDTPAA